MNAKRMILAVRTILHLKPNQVLYQLIRRTIPTYRLPIKNIKPICASNIQMKGFIEGRSKVTSSEFIFLNLSLQYDINRIDWACDSMPRLWRYNLHYFDYINSAWLNLDDCRKIIDSWIVNNPIGKKDAWEPYTVSLRIVNWIKYFQSIKYENIDPRWENVLYQHALWLERNVEYHILANHYLKNGKALLFSGAYFHGKKANKWFTEGLNILLKESQEQILADGGHYEKSPMYHLIVTEDYLDGLNVIKSHIQRKVSPGDIELLENKIMKALDFIFAILMPDGDIPLFNDSAFGIAPAPEDVFDYGKRLVGYRKPPENGSSTTITSLNNTGYYVVKKNKDMLVIDCGSISPGYQPGHTHCDILSYELSIGGKRIVVDSGVYDYEASENRAYCRSTKAHNTVVVDGKEQSELWGVFRVARRAGIREAGIKSLHDDAAEFVGSYAPYWAGEKGVSHERQVLFNGSNEWIFSDIVAGSGIHQIESFIHLHPSITIDYSLESIELKKSGKIIAKLMVPQDINVIENDSWYFPEFGKKLTNKVICLSNKEKLPCEIMYRIVSVSSL